MWSFLAKGSFFIYPLLVCSVVSFALIIERFISLTRTRRFLSGFIPRLKKTVENGSIKDAVDLCSKHSKVPLTNIYKRGLVTYRQQKYDKPSTNLTRKEEIKQALQESANVELPVLEKNLGTLSTIAYITPLLGFLGTVTGMIRAFQRVQELASTGQAVGPGDLAGGIWEALITTAVGLSIAIPTYLAYAYFKNYSGKIIEEIERNAIWLINHLPQYKNAQVVKKVR